MKRRNVIGPVCLLLTFLSTSNASAQSSTVLGSLEKASIRALAWFKALGAPIAEIVAAEERTQLLEALSDLSKDLYAIEQDKQVFIQLLKRDTLDQDAIYSRTGKLMTSIDKARQSLRRLGPILRQRYQVGGAEVEALLSDAAIARKIWVAELYGAPRDSIRRQALIAEGERAL
ncbi:MAG: hypothetical protein M3461_16050 [Pseudomonadota bacterium]|nr:hypothetical protein [Pseudomonadota bacterium]